MTTPLHSTASFFEAKYRRSADPWNFESSDYELRRYEAIVKALDHSRYESALEPGCSVGVLTEELAGICERVLAFDFSPTAVQQAAQRCRRFSHVRIACIGLQEIESFSPFDLVVLSEIGYYFSKLQWQRLTQRIVGDMKLGSTLLAAHWTGRSADHEISGDEVHEVLLAHPQLRLQHSERPGGFRLERWERL